MAIHYQMSQTEGQTEGRFCHSITGICKSSHGKHCVLSSSYIRADKPVDKTQHRIEKEWTIKKELITVFVHSNIVSRE